MLQAPLKMSQYSKEEKIGFSQIHAGTLITDVYQPKPFDSEYKKPIWGIIISQKDTLWNDRFYTGDAGTDFQPYEFNNFVDAKAYYEEQTTEKKLFATGQLEEFKQEIIKNPLVYNEALARVRWSEEASNFIFTHQIKLNTDAFVIYISQFWTKQLKASGRCHEDYFIPVRRYIPEDSSLHLKEVTAAEKEMCRLEAYRIWNSSILKKQEYKKIIFPFYYC